MAGWRLHNGYSAAPLRALRRPGDLSSEKVQSLAFSPEGGEIAIMAVRGWAGQGFCGG